MFQEDAVLCEANQLMLVKRSAESIESCLNQTFHGTAFDSVRWMAPPDRDVIPTGNANAEAAFIQTCLLPLGKSSLLASKFARVGGKAHGLRSVGAEGVQRHRGCVQLAHASARWGLSSGGLGRSLATCISRTHACVSGSIKH